MRSAVSLRGLSTAAGSVPVATEVSQSVTCIFALADERAVGLCIKMRGAEHHPDAPISSSREEKYWSESLKSILSPLKLRQVARKHRLEQLGPHELCC